jgi:hypothetical protein
VPKGVRPVQHTIATGIERRRLRSQRANRENPQQKAFSHDSYIVYRLLTNG